MQIRAWSERHDRCLQHEPYSGARSDTVTAVTETSFPLLENAGFSYVFFTRVPPERHRHKLA